MISPKTASDLTDIASIKAGEDLNDILDQIDMRIRMAGSSYYVEISMEERRTGHNRTTVISADVDIPYKKRDMVINYLKAIGYVAYEDRYGPFLIISWADTKIKQLSGESK